MILVEVEDSLVVNAIEVDEENAVFFQELGWIDTQGFAVGVGYIYVDGNFYYDGQIVTKYIEDDEIIEQELP